MPKTNEIIENLQRLEAEKNKSSDLFQKVIDSMTMKKESKHSLIHPCVINGKHSLVYERGLQESHPDSYKLLEKFANVRGYQLVEDRRSDFLEGVKRVKDSGRANVISILMLTASLVSQNAQADLDEYGHHKNNLEDDMTNSQIIPGYDIDLDAFNTRDELISGLLTWINKHSTFSFDAEKIPAVKVVSPRDIAMVAFGGELPAALNPDDLDIYGLYNFYEETIYLVDHLDLSSNKGKGVLLHELVHYLQYQTGIDKDTECMNELESLAYVLEAKFLESHDHEHNITQSHIRNVSQCRT